MDIPRYDIDDDASFSMTKDTDSFHVNGTDENLEKFMAPDYKPSKYRGQDTLDMDGDTLGGSLQSRMSRVSTEQSADSYPFKSTEDDELYSTIRSDMNNTNNLTDTLALKTYQASINEQDEIEEGEVEIRDDANEIEDGEVETRGSVKADHDSVRVTEDEEEDDEDEYDDDDYEDEGDDEEDDGNHTTEPTATYRTDDDDF